MKKILMAMAFLFPFTLMAQTSPVWKEQKTFHGLMSSSFHPAEEGNLNPLKVKADSLLIAAKLWNASAIPDNYKPKETAEQLKKLYQHCAKLKAAVKEKKDDKVLTEMIKQAHDVFHTIVGECKKD